MKLPLIAYIDILSNAFPLGVGVSRWKRVKSEAIIVFVFVGVGAVTELITLFMAFRNLNNLWVLHIYHLIEYVLLALLFSRWQSVPWLRFLIKLSIPFYALFWLISKWTFEGWTGPATYTHTLSAAIFTILTTVALIQLIRSDHGGKGSEHHVPVYQSMHFWVFAGVLLYFTGNVTLFLLIDTVTQFQFLNAVTVWTLHWVLSIVVNVCFMVSFLCLRRQ